MTTWIALLRGINVGGNKKVPMAQLRALVEGLGFANVRTYVQSGNVVFEDGAASGGRPARRRGRAAANGDPRAPAVARRLADGIREEFGFDVSVLVRSRDELAAVIEANPYPQADEAPTTLHVVFLDAAIDPAGVADVDQAAFAPDEFTLAGRELYLLTPGGIGRSKLAVKLTDKRVGGPATARNWRTVQRLLEMADEPA